MTERYITIKEAAGMLGVTPLTLRNWDKKGYLTAYRNPINNYRLYRYADIADFMAEIRESRPGRGVVTKIPVRMEEEATADASAYASPGETSET